MAELNSSKGGFTFQKVTENDNIDLFSSPIQGKEYDFSKVTAVERCFFPAKADEEPRFMYCVRVQGATVPLSSLMSLNVTIGTAKETLESIKKIGKATLKYYRKSHYEGENDPNNRPAVYEWGQSK